MADDEAQVGRGRRVDAMEPDYPRQSVSEASISNSRSFAQFDDRQLLAPLQERDMELQLHTRPASNTRLG
jgi:hypothetical protein